MFLIHFSDEQLYGLSVYFTFTANETTERDVKFHKQNLLLRKCPADAECGPPIILDRAKKWSNIDSITDVDIEFLIEYKVDLPNNTVYINSDTTKIGLESLVVQMLTLRGNYNAYSNCCI